VFEVLVFLPKLNPVVALHYLLRLLNLFFVLYLI